MQVEVDAGRARGKGLAAPFVLVTAGRDIVWRGRRWAIATVGASVAFSVTLLLAGFLASFSSEVDGFLDRLGGDGYVVRDGAPGPFTTAAPVAADRSAQLSALPGVTRADPIITLPYNLRIEGEPAVIDVQLVGMEPDALPDWPIREGRPIRGPGEVVLDSRALAGVGDTVVLGDRRLTVVGTTRGVHVIAGKGIAWTTVSDAQALVFGGLPAVSGYRLTGFPTSPPDGFDAVDRDAAEADLLRLVQPVIESIETMRLMMWVVAAAVVGSVLYLTAVERVRDFAVLKATGARDRDLAVSLLLQAAMLAAVSSVIAIGLAMLLAPTFPTPILFEGRMLVLAPVVSVLIGAVGSLAGVRRAMRTDPALAFGAA